MADAIIKAYEDVKHHIPEEAPDSDVCPLLVRFKMGDIRAFVRNVQRMRESAKAT